MIGNILNQYIDFDIAKFMRSLHINNHLNKNIKMLKNQLLLIIFFIILPLSFVIKNNAYAEENQIIRKACETYNKAYEMYNYGQNSLKEKSLVEIEELLMEAINLIPENKKKICYEKIESVLQHGNSRFPRYENVDVTKCQNYLPNKLLLQVRSKLPPEPWTLIQVRNNNNGGYLIDLCIFNYGKTYMEDIIVTIKGDIPNLSSQTIDYIMPNSKKKIQWSTLPVPKGLFKTVNIIFDEKYSFAPCNIQFHP